MHHMPVIHLGFREADGGAVGGDVLEWVRWRSVEDEVLASGEDFDGGVEVAGVGGALGEHVQHDDSHGREVDSPGVPERVSALRRVVRGDTVEHCVR